jgi:cytochrome c1
MKLIAVCNNCGRPLVSTMVFPGAEYFCTRCKSRFGMMDVDEVAATPELLKQLKADTTFFKRYAKDLWFGRVKKAGCVRCAEGWHTEHLTEKEVAAMEKAKKVLMEVKE